MKRVVLLFVIGLVASSLSSRAAQAQRSGSMQATARVLDTRESRTGLESARDIASRLALGQQSPATVETGLTRVSLTLMKSPEQALDRPRTAQVTINYLRN